MKRTNKSKAKQQALKDIKQSGNKVLSEKSFKLITFI